VGRNGLFYDRKGRDWDATITKIIENPISIRQAFWSPYKKFLRMIEEQVAKRAAAADTAATARLQTAAVTATTVPPPAPGAPAAPATPATPPPAKKFDVGTIAALGVALGALSTAFGLVFAKVVELPGWQLPLVVIGVILAISLPSVVIAWLKLRQRTIAPLLEANGWAINGRVKVNIPFGTALTERALLPSNAKRTLGDPYEDKGPARRRRLFLLLLLLILAAFAVRWDHNRRGHYFWQQPAAATR
jgi:MFS family permease